MRIRFAGFGGQGVVLCGFMFGKAAMLDGRNSIQTQSYGSASRGGHTKTDVSIEDGENHDLVHDQFDVLVTLSQASYEKYQDDLLPGGVLFYESDLMSVAEGKDRRVHGAGVTDIAFKKFGRKIMANMIRPPPPMTGSGRVANTAPTLGISPRQNRITPAAAATWRLNTPVKFTSPTFWL